MNVYDIGSMYERWSQVRTNVNRIRAYYLSKGTGAHSLAVTLFAPTEDLQ